jgi:Coenzyme PQQ synthesis protein D (PqqD)
LDKRFRVGSPRVMHETIEGEVILIALDTGTYYSLRESGADVWEGVAHGASQNEIVAALSSRYDGAPDEIEAAVAELLARLEEERLIEAAHDGDASGWADDAPATKRPFAAPVFEKHTDMQDLILLDPVHEVDPRGWPHPAPS